MGTTLTGKQINQTYDGLLKSTDNDPITSEKRITDGLGNDLPLKMSQTSIKFPGIVNFSETTSFVSAPWALSTDLTALEGDVISLSGDVGTNTSNISTNTSNISTNTSNISTNTSNISTNTSQISTNTSLIAANNSAIAQNIIDITAISGDVITNTSNISTNTSNISTNTTDISNLQSGVGNVISVNTLDGAITLSAGTNVNITDNGTDTITISSTGGGGGGGISWNGSTANAVGTYGSSTTIDAESKLLFSSSNLDILGTNTIDGIRLFGGIVGVSNPVISNTTGSNFSSINVDTNLILTNQHKIAFDGDLTNTYIAADLSNPENLEIHADANVRIWADEAFEVWEPVATPSKMFSIAPDATGTQPRITIGSNTNTDFWLDTGGLTRVRGLYYLDDVPSAGRGEGQTIFKGSTTTTLGYIYVWDGSVWSLASVSNCTGLLGIALGTNSGTDGMIINGIAGAPTGSYTSGAVLYISDTTPGLLSTSAPTGSGEIVRRVGYGLGGITYTFTPSMEYITLT